MIATIRSAAVVGLDAQAIDVEVDVRNGLPTIVVVGLPDTAVQESRERVKSALKSLDIPLPAKRVVVNLAPADLRKEGPAYDLPIAVGILGGMGILKAQYPDSLFVGELALGGEVRPVKGVLSMALAAKAMGLKQLYLPAANAPEAALIEGVAVYPVAHLGELLSHLTGAVALEPLPAQGWEKLRREPVWSQDMAQVKGQEHVKRALEIAAAGGHNILMSGPPGSGKTMLARTVPSILPELGLEESLETTKIFSVAGLLPAQQALITERPFRSPHHTTSRNALVGGGSWPKPGEISLAHRGVLFLDEFPEFPSPSLEALRQPLEDGVVTISRVQGTLSFPAQFILVAAMNPCPCGYAGDPERSCSCAPFQIERYQKKISGPLLDRIDLHVQVPRVAYDKLAAKTESEPSVAIRERVEAARLRQRQRTATSVTINAHLSAKQIKQHCALSEEGQGLLRQAAERMQLSGRAYHRILKVARTIADLHGLESILPAHVAEAIQYRLQTE